MPSQIIWQEIGKPNTKKLQTVGEAHIWLNLTEPKDSWINFQNFTSRETDTDWIIARTTNFTYQK